MTNRRRKKRLKFKNMNRFLIVIAGGLAVIGAAVLLVRGSGGRGEIQFGSIDAELTAAAAVVRDEKVVMTEPYEKISFNAVEARR